MQKSMRLKYEPSSEPLIISAVHAEVGGARGQGLAGAACGQTLIVLF